MCIRDRKETQAAAAMVGKAKTPTVVLTIRNKKSISASIQSVARALSITVANASFMLE